MYWSFEFCTAADRLKVCMVESVVYDKSTGKTTGETRFFISSLPVDPKRALDARALTKEADALENSAWNTS